jgi:uncharacterized FlaG/YvyC family protein
MSIQVPPAGPQDAAALAAVQSRPQANAVDEPKKPYLEPVPAAKNDTTPSRPPAQVLEEMEAASRRYDELRSQHRELHFTRDETQNRVVVEVRDTDGNVLRTIPPSKALDVIAGAPLD